jgi:hypothetical protein
VEALREAGKVPLMNLEARIVEGISVASGEWDCWLWRGAKSDRGYGTISVEGRTCLTHRVMYEIVIGPILEDLELDHLCRQRACANPFHCEPVTHQENLLRGENFVAMKARQTHCVNGHLLSDENVYIRPDTGTRQCRKCKNLRQRKG